MKNKYADELLMQWANGDICVSDLIDEIVVLKATIQSLEDSLDSAYADLAGEDY